MNNNAIRIIFLLCTLWGCKSVSSSNNQNESVQESSLLILIQEDVSPNEIPCLKPFWMDMKQVSRSQNLWMVRVGEEQTIAPMVESLKCDQRILDVYLSQDSKGSNSNNAKSGKSNSIRNN